jgi:hypothetical protein
LTVLIIILANVFAFSAETAAPSPAAAPVVQPAAQVPAQSAPQQTPRPIASPTNLRRTSPQDTVATQAQDARETATMQESLEAVNRNKNKYTTALPADFDDWSQYGVKKKLYLRFNAGFGYALLDTITGAPRNYDWSAHYNGAGYSFGANDNKLIYDFTFMPTVKISRRRYGNKAIGFGMETGLIHITEMKNSPGHYWGIPLNFVVQFPLYKMFSRLDDLIICLGAGVFIPYKSNYNKVHADFLIHVEHNFDVGKKILIPVFAKIRFIFRKNIYWGVVFGTGVTF